MTRLWIPCVTVYPSILTQLLLYTHSLQRKTRRKTKETHGSRQVSNCKWCVYFIAKKPWGLDRQKRPSTLIKKQKELYNHTTPYYTMLRTNTLHITVIDFKSNDNKKEKGPSVILKRSPSSLLGLSFLSYEYSAPDNSGITPRIRIELIQRFIVAYFINLERAHVSTFNKMRHVLSYKH